MGRSFGGRAAAVAAAAATAMRRARGRALLAAAAAAAVLLSGCAVIPADITELETLPKLTPEHQAIESALEAKVGSRFTLRYPLEGTYRSAFVLRTGKNGASEAYAFYSPTGTSGPCIAYLARVNGRWKLIGNGIGSAGSEIDSVDFADFNGDGNEELAVGWRSFNSTDLVLMVYTKKPDGSFGVQNLGTFTKLVTLDMTGEGRPDILKLKLDSNVKSAVASLISYRDGALREVARTPLDSTVTGYDGVYAARLADGTPAVLVDGAKTSHKMITELLYYADGALHSPFFSSKAHTVTATLRSDAYSCMDLDGDHYYEIPVPEELPHPALKKGGEAPIVVNWTDYSIPKGLVVKYSCVMNYAEDYYVRYPALWKRSVTVVQPDARTMEFVEWNAKRNTYGPVLFTIRVFSDEDWLSQQGTAAPYTLLQETNGTVFAVKLGAEKGSYDPLFLTLDEIKKYFNVF